MPRAPSPSDAVLRALRAFGLGYPGAHEKCPWPGHRDLAVRDKTFAYLSVEGEPFSISCKLPQSSEVALALPFAKPTAYGLGKSGWVTAAFAAGEVPPLELLQAWIDESYRAQAPKKLVAALAGGGGRGAGPRTRAAAAKALKARARVAGPKAKPRAKRAAGAKGRASRR